MPNLDRLTRLGSPGPLPDDGDGSANANHTEEMYRIWASDDQLYGPIAFPILAHWVEEGRVLRQDWIYLEGNQEWHRAQRIEALHDHFPPGTDTQFLEWQAVEGGGVAPNELRQFPIFSSLSNQELAYLIRFGKLLNAHPGQVIVKRCDPGDAVFFVLAGSVRARLLLGGEEKSLTQIVAGQFFGELAMLTKNARSADVVAEEETRLLRLGAQGFRLLIAESPAAAAPMLFAIAATMAQRIVEDNYRFQREIATEFLRRRRVQDSDQ